jgi:NAD(P)-dependent dehydrogenase (short-subunit alcohol dehydrogenase family)
MKVELQGQVAVVTGAAQGIGKSIADRLAANGARVIYADVQYEVAAESAASQSLGVAMAMDVTRDDQVQEVMDRTVQEYGRLDILVNNAGVNTLEHRVTIDEFPREEWDRLLAVDLTGLYVASKAAAQIMRSQQSGKIINIASVVGIVPLRLQSPFVAAKAGVINLTRSMAIELGPYGILVNAIAPGSTLTDGTKELFYGEGGKFRDSVQELLNHIPLGRPATTDEIAHATLFLAAPESSYINGHVLTVDGGWSAGYMREF